MKISPDTDVLVRFIVDDDARQAELAKREFARAEAVAISTATLCELVWVLMRAYKRPKESVATALSLLIGSAKVVTDRAAAEAGLAILRHGGDFADGVIAFQGAAFGGDVFVSFDKKAVKLLAAQGISARAPQDS